MNSRKVLAVSASVMMLGGLIYKMSPLSQESSNVAEMPTAQAPQEDKKVVTSSLEKAAALPVSSEIATKPVTAADNKIWEDFPHKKDLKQYHDLRGKVFLSEADKAFRREVLEDERKLMSLAELLKTPANSEEHMNLQNAALDILLESLHSSAPQAAIEILRGVLADTTVENAALSLSERQNLGGIKAEILFQWTSLFPESRNEIEGLLPGPASKKIWSNVQIRQQSNLAESSLELKQ